MKERVIFDLDNCISDDGWRIDTIDWSRSVEEGRYGVYHAAASADSVANLSVVAHHVALGRDLIFLTARPVGCYVTTCEWLAQNLDLDDVSTYTLLMRESADHRPSVEVKESMLAVLDHWNIPLSSIVAAYDDRPDVIDMYRRRGIKGAQVLSVHNLDAYSQAQGAAKADAERDALAYGIGDGLQQLADSMAHVTYATARPRIEMIPETRRTAADILGDMAETFRQRNAVYGSNYEMVGPIMKILFPKGAPPELLGNNAFHLFELAVVKLSRLAISQLQHKDSAHDAAVYCAMIEMIIEHGEKR